MAIRTTAAAPVQLRQARMISMPDDAHEAQFLGEQLPVADKSSLEGFEEFHRERAGRDPGGNDRTLHE